MRLRYHSVVEGLYQRFGTRLKTVVLFGSQARNDAHPESDHDIFVMIDSLPADPVARQRIVRGALLPVLGELPGAISLIARTPEEVASNLTPLLLDICADGICLWGSGEFEPYRAKALAALAASPLRRQRVGETLMWVSPHTPPRNWRLNWEGYVEYASNSVRTSCGME
ncbi:MAG: nucleotidyltransferase domain-containing protein [Chloroflexi bacterium]|nr:nucleotidyltransferase domain-containing protein [Chloroflexota bacterium]